MTQLTRCFATIAALLCTTAQAAEFTCESQDKRRAECSAPDRGTIRLVRQLSKTRCVEGQTWGQTGSGVYVSGGCRAVFDVDSRGGSGRPDRQGEPQVIRNELDHQRDRGLPEPGRDSRSERRGPTGHADMVGERAIDAQNQLVSRGYQLLGSRDGSDRRWTYFRTPDGRQCIQALVIKGRVNRFDTVSQNECARGDLTVWGAGSAESARESYENRNRPANDRYADDRYPDSERRGDRGDDRYRHDDDRYRDERDDRYREDDYRDRRYERGYDDLIGERASSAERSLESRGYRYVRTVEGRRSDYVYYESSDRRQCLRATVEDGRYRDITERDRSDCR